MLRNITARRIEEHTTFTRFFERKGRPGSGYSFDCDEAGTVNVEALTPVQRGSWDAAHGEGFADRGVQEFTHRHTEPATGRCECGRMVVLYGFTNACDCGRDYNMSGQELAPRSQWGEETGEHWTECL